MGSPSLDVVIPCLNEDQTILAAVTSAHKELELAGIQDFKVWVADNGSTDNTLAILKAATHLKNLRVIHVGIRGYGAALHWGIMTSQADYVLFADADMSYPFSNIGRLGEKLKSSPDLILGSRLRGNIQSGAMPFLNRYLGTPVLTFLIRNFYGLKTSDCNSGMRVVRKKFYEQLKMKSPGMEWASELLLKSALNGVHYVEVPIEFHKDQRNRPPHLARWPDGWRHLKTIILFKPSMLYPFFFVFLGLGWAFLNTSFPVASFFMLLAGSLFLGILEAHLLFTCLESSETFISKLLKKFRVVPLTGIVSLVLFSGILFLPDRNLGTKMLLGSIINILLLWAFSIESIKTQALARLPNKLIDSP